MTDLFDTKTDTLERVTRCLSLIQPWATLVTIGAKRYETRSWATSYRGWLAIHASKGFPTDCREYALEPPCNEVLHAAGLRILRDLPLGQVIAVAHLVDCVSTNAWSPPAGSNEEAFGDYSEDRFAWRFDDVRRVRPFAARGSLSIWKLPRPLNQGDLL